MVSVHLHESWVAYGGSMKKQNNVDDNFLSVWSILVKFAIFFLPQRHANSNIGDGRQRSFIFGYTLGDFSREWSCFLMSFAANYEANSWTFRCVVLSRKDAGFTSLKGNSKQKLSFYKETYANSAILYWLLKGFSHSSIVLTLYILLSWFQNKSDVSLWHWIGLLYWPVWYMLLYGVIIYAVSDKLYRQLFWDIFLVKC